MGSEVVRKYPENLLEAVDAFFTEGKELLKKHKGKIIIPGKLGAPTMSQEFYFSDRGRGFFCMSMILHQTADFCSKRMIPQVGYIKDQFDEKLIIEALTYILKHLKDYLLSHDVHIHETDVDMLLREIIKVYEVDISLDVFASDISSTTDMIGGQVKQITSEKI